jgi:tetratricopeptide (TPR) repeat protein
MPTKPLLFLSHSGVDTEDARELKRRIEASPSAREVGLTVWFDKDDLEPGSRTWQRQLEQAINDRCTAFAVYVGSKGVMNWVESEVSLGLSRATTDRSFPFIPILAQKSTASALPPFAALYQAVRDPLNDPAEMEKFLKAVLEPRGPVVILDEPFVGLRAMTEADAARFFGRSAEINELVQRLENSRLVAVVADSGSGKSSLVQAGLIPKFRGGVFAANAREELASRIWHVVTTRPGSAPFAQLRKAVTTASERLALSPKEKAELGDLIDPSKPQQIAYALQCNLPTEATETLLVIDQFEELFTQTPEHLRGPFIDWVLSLVAPGAVLGFRVILTIRSDYFNLCSTHPGLFALLKQDKVKFRLKRITDEGLAEAVRKPLLMAGHKDSAEQDALIAQIRRDVSDRPGDLALVQMALFETWKRHKIGQYGLLEAYTEVGGVSGALAHAAEEVRTKKLDAKQQALLEPIFVRLINLGDTSGATRRVARIDEFDDSRRDLIKVLSEERSSRLLLLSAETVDICHEQLITQWPWLQSHIAESAVDVRRLSRLIEKVRDWHQTEAKDKDQYLATGAELEIFDNLEGRHRDWLSPPETQYVAASKNARQREERHRNWLFRGLAAASILFAVATVIATLLFWESEARRNEAQTNFDIAKKGADDLAFRLAQNLPLLQNRRAQVVWEILVSARSLIDRLALEEPHSREVQKSRLAILIQIATAYLSRGDITSALAATEECQRIIHLIDASKEDSGLCLERLGDARLWAGDANRAAVAYSRSLDMFEKLISEQQDEFYRGAQEIVDREGHYRMLYRDLALAVGPGERKHMRVSVKRGDAILRVGNAAEAIALYQAVVQKVEDTKWFPDKYYKGVALVGAGKAFLSTKNVSAALDAFLSGVTTLRAVLQRDDDDNMFDPGEEIGSALEGLGDAQAASGNWSAAVGSYRESLEHRKTIVSADPSNCISKLTLSNILVKVVDSESLAKRNDMSDEASRILKELIEDGPDSPSPCKIDRQKAHEAVAKLKVDSNHRPPDPQPDFVQRPNIP